MLNLIGGLVEFTSRPRPWVKPVLLAGLVAVCFFALCPEADAAPGGQFVKQALSSKFGRIGGIIVGVLLLLAALLLLPLLLYVKYAESAGIRKTKKDLAVLAEKYGWFEWLGIRDRVNQAVRKIADVWSSGNLSSVSSFMTPDYFASQQDTLQRWIDEGKQIVYRLQKVRRIEPLAVRVEDEETYSWIRVLVTVDCVDYMRDQYTKEVVKGEVGTTSSFESVWCFTYQNREWLLSGIEEGSTSLSWASEKNHIDTHFLDLVISKQRQKVQDAAQASAKARPKSQASSLDVETNTPAAKPKERLVRKPSGDQDQ